VDVASAAAEFSTDDEEGLTEEPETGDGLADTPDDENSH
jgi:hypothetical protein